jgi:hypothetical protein
MIIYKAHNKVNGKIYVGQTKKNVEQRILEHLKYTKNTYFSNALRKYGLQSFEISVIDVSENVEILNEKEKYWIKFFNCRAPNGYNLTDGGEGVINPSDITREKLSEAGRGRPSPNKGKCFSEEWKKKISESHKNPTEETRTKMREAKKGKRMLSLLGKPRSEETKKKISEKLIGRLSSEETKRKLSQLRKGKRRGIYKTKKKDK